MGALIGTDVGEIVDSVCVSISDADSSPPHEAHRISINHRGALNLAFINRTWNSQIRLM